MQCLRRERPFKGLSYSSFKEVAGELFVLGLGHPNPHPAQFCFAILAKGFSCSCGRPSPYFRTARSPFSVTLYVVSVAAVPFPQHGISFLYSVCLVYSRTPAELQIPRNIFLSSRLLDPKSFSVLHQKRNLQVFGPKGS